MEFSKNLQKLRKEKGLSQEALAEMINVSRQAVSKWESGQSYPETDKLITISEIFGVTLDNLIKDSELQDNSQNTVATPFWAMRGSFFEYKSKRIALGLPLVHVHIGFGFKRAKGIIAIGNIATGIISIGLLAKGIMSFGLVSLGLIATGCLSFGLLLAVGAIAFGIFAIGAVAIGIFALGALAIGMFSFGTCTVASSHVAIGDYAYGHIAVGRTVANGVKTFFGDPFRHNFANVSAEEVRQVISAEYPNMWHWIVNLITLFLGN